MCKAITSPIFYMGNKKRLINKGLIDLFPKEINTLYDVFGGSGVISMNTSALSYCINDYSPYIFQFYSLFKQDNASNIIKQIEANVDKYKLPKEATHRNKFKDTAKIEEYKKNYKTMVNDYNKTKKTIDLYTLMFFAFSQQFRFSKQGNFNMPFGDYFFSDNNKENIVNGCKFFNSEKVEICNSDFRHILNRVFKKDDFVYLDPPYFNTTATYNESNGWTYEQEKDLRQAIEKLNHNGIKFGMSNVFENKDFVNIDLVKWCVKNNFKAYSVNNFKYSACGKSNSKTLEVYICNYDVGISNENFIELDLDKIIKEFENQVA